MNFGCVTENRVNSNSSEIKERVSKMFFARCVSQFVRMIFQIHLRKNKYKISAEWR